MMETNKTNSEDPGNPAKGSSFLHPTPLLDQLEGGKWPSFVTGFKKLAERTKKPMVRGVLDQLEYSYRTRMGYWKGGVVGVRGYGAGVIARFSMIADQFPEASEFHTFRIQPAPGLHYNVQELRELCDLWEKYGSGIMGMHGQTGDIMLQGIENNKVQEFFDEINQRGWDLGGAGTTVRSSVSCVGPARCEQACYDTLETHYRVLQHYTDLVHRPSLPYKFKFKFSGCANDCTNSIMRSDVSVIGTWRDSIQVRQEAVQEFIAEKGVDYLTDYVIKLCPTQCISLDEKNRLKIDSPNCVRCMHCLNVMPKALSPGKEKGITVLVGGKGHLKVGSMMGTLIIPFLKLESDEDYENFLAIADRMIEWWSEAALDHERIGETIERVGMRQFLEEVGLEPNVDMVSQPRDNPYFKAKY